MVGHNHTVVFGQRLDHVPVQVSPGRLAVQADDRLAIPGAFVHEVLDKAVAVERVRGERERPVVGLIEGDH